jgi:integrase
MGVGWKPTLTAIQHKTSEIGILFAEIGTDRRHEHRDDLLENRERIYMVANKQRRLEAGASERDVRLASPFYEAAAVPRTRRVVAPLTESVPTRASLLFLTTRKFKSYVHSILRSALQAALRSDLVSRNVALLATLPKSSQGERTFLDAEQSTAFLTAAMDDEWFALWVLLLSTGARLSEALALQWGDLKGDSL